ncbi:DUF3152 domain-containing protein [Actinomadura graeca]|uniref:DUF3152 domain-containing protein n=2 Tax=Actinomadura graeca TaxID=2750812 RepID=A0ABX8R8S4_9ACTN|nr:DUF3152 domain-containing protein [Actinomadura graeca]
MLSTAMQPPRSRTGRRRAASHRRGARPAPTPAQMSVNMPAPPPRRRPPGGVEGISDALEREFEGARRTRMRGLVLGTASLALVIAVGIGCALALRSATGSGSGSGSSSSRKGQGGDRGRTGSGPGLGAPESPYIPAKGTGKFLRPASTGRVYGHGKPMRYMVEVEGGLRQDPAAFASSVDKILADPRGWTAAGKWSFRRVASGPYDFVVRLASPGTVDRLCGGYGLETEGKVNCSGGKQVVVNLRRWLLLTAYYRGRPDEYHALTINHEVGHRLGFGHMTCPGRGRPAPVMQQQIFGMKGCAINGWPYDRRRRFLGGPSVP